MFKRWALGFWNPCIKCLNGFASRESPSDLKQAWPVIQRACLQQKYIPDFVFRQIVMKSLKKTCDINQAKS